MRMETLMVVAADRKSAIAHVRLCPTRRDSKALFSRITLENIKCLPTDQSIYLIIITHSSLEGALTIFQGAQKIARGFQHVWKIQKF